MLPATPQHLRAASKTKGDTDVHRLAALLGTRVHEQFLSLLVFYYLAGLIFLSANKSHRNMADFYAEGPSCHN